MPSFEHPKGWNFSFGGMNLKDRPDSLPPGKFAVAQNVRGVSGQALRVRPGYTALKTGLGNLTDLRGYATLGTDDLPVYLLRSTSNAIILSSSGSTVVTLAGAAGSGVSMVSFRPGASPQSWMYIAGLGDYQKVSAPSSGSVTVQKVGIAEPYSTSLPVPVVGAVPNAPSVHDFSGASSGWTAGPSLSGLSNAASSITSENLFSDTTGTVLADPLLSSRLSVGVGLPGLYLQGMEISISSTLYQVQAVLAACPSASFNAVKYYSGSSGACQIAVQSDISASLQRGSLIEINSTETVLVLGVVTGPNGVCAIETSTTGSYSSGTLTGVACIILYGSVSSGATVTSPTVQASVAGASGTPTPSVIGWISQSLSSNPFQGFSENDYLHFLLEINYIQSVSAVSILFSIGSGSPTFSSYLSYTISGAALATQALAGELFDVTIPLSDLLAEGQALPANINGVMLQVTMAPGSGSWPIAIGSLWVGGGSNPDTGASGAPYQYMAVPRSSLTGAQGNPTADMRYGVFPRRQSVTLSPPSASYDSQIDTWDFYRYGGTITSFHYIGSCGTGQTFVDNVYDTSATAGQVLVTDNFEPWPSIDIPYPASGTSVAVTGSWATLTASSYPPNILRWLPGTLVSIGGNVYTLRGRPFGSGPYTFEVEECVGHYTSSILSVSEPLLARQILPYLIDPDSTGTVFGLGDPSRPGIVFPAKANSPDAASDQDVMELCPPSEPMIGGQLMNGNVYVASSKRWWALYPSLGGTTETTSGAVVTISVGTTRYTAVEIPVGMPLAAPYGHCTDGENIFFWTSDGIARTSGGPAESLTDADLYPIFPHEGTPGSSVTRLGVSVAAPDYSRAATFRLAVNNGFLYADYQDTSGNAHTLVCDLKTLAWCVDLYGAPVTCHYGNEQQQGTLLSSPALYPSLLMVTGGGLLVQEADLSNDNGLSISCLLGTFEWDGGDSRALTLFGDCFLDCVPVAALTVTPVSEGAQVAVPTTLSASTSRQFAPISLEGGLLERFVGLELSWTENFSTQTSPTLLFLWQASLVSKPETTQDRVEDWEDFGGAFYFRGFTLRADTFGSTKNIAIESADTNTTMASFEVVGTGEQELGYAFSSPFVAHMVRVAPLDSVPWRKFSFSWIKDKWPELTSELSPWMDFGTPDSKYMEGLKVPMDTNGAAVSFQLFSPDSGSVTLGPVTTPAGEKTVVAFPIPAPFVGHQFQLRPLSPCRVWFDEVKGVWQPTPESVVSWGPTQWTAFGLPGFSTIPFLDVAYSSSSVVTLQVSAQGGTSPSVVSLPSSGGVYLRSRVYLSPNKGLAWQFQATSPGAFQVFLEDWIAWVGAWGREGPLREERLLGGPFGAKDEI